MQWTKTKCAERGTCMHKWQAVSNKLRNETTASWQQFHQSVFSSYAVSFWYLLSFAFIFRRHWSLELHYFCHQTHKTKSWVRDKCEIDSSCSLKTTLRVRGIPVNNIQPRHYVERILYSRRGICYLALNWRRKGMGAGVLVSGVADQSGNSTRLPKYL